MGCDIHMNIEVKTKNHSCKISISSQVMKLAECASLPQSSDFRETDLEYAVLHTYCEGNSFAGIKKYNDGPGWITDCRLVFWFDN